jgi:hypothetical protein
MIEGLVVKENEGKITVEYQDVIKLDLSRVIERIFDKLFGPAFQRPQNVIPITKENTNG